MGLAGGDAAEGQPRRELGTEVEPEHAIASVFVGRYAAAGDKLADAVVASSFAAMKWVCGGGLFRERWWVVDAERRREGLEKSCDGVFQIWGDLEWGRLWEYGRWKRWEL